MVSFSSLPLLLICCEASGLGHILSWPWYSASPRPGSNGAKTGKETSKSVSQNKAVCHSDREALLMQRQSSMFWVKLFCLLLTCWLFCHKILINSVNAFSSLINMIILSFFFMLYKYFLFIVLDIELFLHFQRNSYLFMVSF